MVSHKSFVFRLFVPLLESLTVTRTRAELILIANLALGQCLTAYQAVGNIFALVLSRLEARTGKRTALNRRSIVRVSLRGSKYLAAYNARPVGYLAELVTHALLEIGTLISADARTVLRVEISGFKYLVTVLAGIRIETFGHRGILSV